MKKWIVITLKQRIIYDSLSGLLMVKLFEAFEQEIKDGKIYIDDKGFNDKDKGMITVEMEGTEDEIKAWTKKSLRERIGLGMARMALKIDIIDG